MPTKHQTFTDGQILAAGDVNDSLNPDTAPHIPYAVAAGALTVPKLTTASQVQVVNAVFPAGRFTVAPLMPAPNIASSSGALGGKMTARAFNVTPTGFSIAIYQGDGSTIPAGNDVPVTWTAVQMTPSSAAG